jgi:hypothetical protein
LTLLKLCRVLNGTSIDVLADTIGAKRGAISIAERHPRLASLPLRQKLSDYHKAPFSTLQVELDGPAIARGLVNSITAKKASA